ECRDLLDVLKVARMMGKTIEQLQQAVRENERMEKEIAKKEQRIGDLTTEAEVYGENVGKAEQAIKEHGETFLGGLRQAFGVPASLSGPLDRAQKGKEAKEAEIVQAKKELEELKGKLQKELTEGPMRILRSFD